MEGEDPGVDGGRAVTELVEQKEELAVSMQTGIVGTACFLAVESQQLV